MITIRPGDLLDGDSLSIERELPADSLELREQHARPDQPVQVRVTVQRDGPEVLMMGSVETQVELRCGRCGDWMPWPINIADFTASQEVEDENIPLDFTPNIREDVLLELPIVAACELDKDFRCPYSKEVYPPATEPPESINGENVWQALDKLNKEKD